MGVKKPKEKKPTEKKPTTRKLNKEKKKRPVKKSRCKLRQENGRGFRYSKFVEMGRVVLLTGPRYRGQICAIVDIISEVWVLVHGPCTGVPRIPVYMDHLNLTALKIDIPRAADTKTVKTAWNKAEIDRKWSKTGVCRALTRAIKMRSMNDFDHYKLKRIKSKRNNILRTYLKKLKSHPKRLAGILKYRKAKAAGKVKRLDKKELSEIRKKKKLEMKKRGLKRKERAVERKAKKLEEKKAATPAPAAPAVATK